MPSPNRVLPLLGLFFAFIMTALGGCRSEPRHGGVESSGAAPTYPGYTLMFADEFDGNGPADPRNWVHEIGFIRNHEAQWYDDAPENVRREDGVLIIEAHRKRVTNPNFDPSAPEWDWARLTREAAYTSGSIKTLDRHAWTFGRFEMRGRIDIRSGLWPAFWTLGTAREWPGCGEIDIMEFFQSQLLANACWGGSRRWEGTWDDVKIPIRDVASGAGFTSAELWAREFHVWRMDWDKGAVALSVDGRLLNTIDLSRTLNPEPSWLEGRAEWEPSTNPFREPHHIILNLAIGSTGGDPSSTAFPARFEVDWVRVYQANP